MNDSGQEPESVIKSMEGIVRQTWRQLPCCDICFVYTLTERLLPELRLGKFPRVTGVMEALADHYGIPSVHMGLEVVRLEMEGKLAMTVPGAEMTRVSRRGARPGRPAPGGRRRQDPLRRRWASTPTTTPATCSTPRRSNGRGRSSRRPPPRRPRMPCPSRSTRSIWRGPQCCPSPPHGSPAPGRSCPRMASSTTCATVSANGYPVYGRGRRARSSPSASRARQRCSTTSWARTAACWNSPSTAKSPSRFGLTATVPITRLSTLSLGEGLDPREVHLVKVKALDDSLDKEEILFERNRGDVKTNPGKYAGRNWYVGAVLLAGDLA